jgi:TolA-binding protein
VLEAFSGNAKAPAAQLHKGLALLATNKKEAGIHELRALIQRHPQTPEARVARSKLNGMGVKITATATH